MNKHYVLTKGAVADLKEIIRYTNDHLGVAQCQIYIDQLEKAVETLANGEGLFKDLSFIHPKLRMARCERHYIFYLPRKYALPVILAIFHERMDMMARLKSRLG